MSDCGCALHPSGNGDVPCHNCGQYVNKRCWNCKTPRGEGACPNRRETSVELLRGFHVPKFIADRLNLPAKPASRPETAQQGTQGATRHPKQGTDAHGATEGDG